ncbi:hypothetical protein [Acinetobacter sp. ANC 4862]|jgi:hypothetical protein|uniref:hypothetical protein n=1 Tax=Acinetobacter sp. ANC 4862 TaxID=2529849 RepID=UPI00207767BA|nr:hypothetical protein [Acinetobacter sp. ANC 4862]
MDDSASWQFNSGIFHHSELDPKRSWQSACIQVEGLAALYQAWQGLNWAAFPQARIIDIKYLAEIEMFCVMRSTVAY